jgi:hypothetical protein
VLAREERGDRATAHQIACQRPEEGIRGLGEELSEHRDARVWLTKAKALRQCGFVARPRDGTTQPHRARDGPPRLIW